MIGNGSMELEERRLEQVLSEISRQLTLRQFETAKYRSILRGTQEFLKDEVPLAALTFDELVEIAGGMGKLKEAAKMYRFSKDRAEQLKRLLKSPYFARIDFRESGRPRVQVVYIGISSLVDEETGEHLVYDWRAPISSIYYDYEIGPAQYEAPVGSITGELLLKRHFRIKDGRIELMFDNSLTIYDEVLLRTLSEAAGERMRSIVNTIQREQNRVIRGETRGALAVQGAAGSGKTVIALHRAAYLLYKHRDTMDADSILILSPGGLFIDYTSPVLPELGEQPVPQTSFGDLAAEQLRTLSADGREVVVERQADQVENLLDRSGTRGARVRSAGTRLKSSLEFMELVTRYASRLTDTAELLGDVTFRGETVMSAQEAESLFKKDYAYLPLKKRVERIKRRAQWLLDQAEERRAKELERQIAESQESAHLFAKEIRKMSRAQARQEIQPARQMVAAWTTVSVLDAYARLFEEPGLLNELGGERLLHMLAGDDPHPDAPEHAEDSAFVGLQPKAACPTFEEVARDSQEALRSSVIRYEDAAPLLLLRGLLEGFPDEGKIRHVIIDEAQDCTPSQLHVIRRWFPTASFTLLGDANQAAFPGSSFTSYEEMSKETGRIFGDLGPVVPVRLSESYRSTKEITEFTRAILAGGEPVQAVERPGELPVVFESSADGLAESVAADVASLRADGFSSIVVICKTARESWAAFDAMKGIREFARLKPRLVKPDDDKFRRGVLVIPSYLAKGLEFEAVVVYDASSGRYRSPSDRRLLYAVCTRALHRLHVHCAGELTPFISEVDPGLYVRKTFGTARDE